MCLSAYLRATFLMKRLIVSLREVNSVAMATTELFNTASPHDRRHLLSAMQLGLGTKLYHLGQLENLSHPGERRAARRHIHPSASLDDIILVTEFLVSTVENRAIVTGRVAFSMRWSLSASWQRTLGPGWCSVAPKPISRGSPPEGVVVRPSELQLLFVKYEQSRHGHESSDESVR
ncbi:hypothetical protein DPEC_G00069030 [Dallia pectoralis]|uniref:Uncharacterized protein n=1 Tax=Dallia pectoralis TaxID=75939 RepID=A0ACC2H2H1_DALPE|nr:hypothetical protein DPEC_G00069030 [Dallia pectoralis]